MKGMSFSPDMLAAVLAGDKTETRRPKKGAPKFKVGDKVFIREEHYVFGSWYPCKSAYKSFEEADWRFMRRISDVLPVFFDRGEIEDVAMNPVLNSMDKKLPRIPRWYKRNKLFMPAEYARYFIEITGVKTERLCDISDGACYAEGIQCWWEPMTNVEWYGISCSFASTSPKLAFKYLWESIYGAGSFDQKEVYVYQFKLVK